MRLNRVFVGAMAVACALYLTIPGVAVSHAVDSQDGMPRGGWPINASGQIVGDLKDAGDALYAYLHGPTDTSGAVEIADAVETWAAKYPATLQVVYSNFRLSP